VSFLLQPTCFLTRADLHLFDGIAWFHWNKHYFMANDKLYLEKSPWTPFCQFRFPRVRPIVLQPWKKPSSIPCLEGKVLNALHLPLHLHQQSLVSWPSRYFNGVFVWCNWYWLHLHYLPPNMRCVIPVITYSFHLTGGPRHLWWNCMISPKQTQLCGLW
jgi:hypothetical protein